MLSTSVSQLFALLGELCAACKHLVLVAFHVSMSGETLLALGASLGAARHFPT
ncbi:hypothetical protein PF005_g9859 [Phytophthora fragariae]|uniref:Uncharacterized protein n=1 Tax=Phytophthora fragariae TaxID=53985 RepID=A0A6A3F3L6_9STRA|nr:hypothetical protein PF003_g27767 [Phytophthora fragariae]KAE8939979.1 hypothetical protein PF009_g10191 [Phytophthora fragariae]KAE8978879.1 hypothetical protein PF011_g23062 [Phytophthora fragariae]KAE9097214.1 hypothetical protein PF006_g23621 [Phytophthora fragariae]KAE9110164.1 hypothetical protein PF010_g11261 [Phytophthora fragariae]